MIELTPLDVRKKKEDFRKAVRGYDTGEVDAFLDLVADRMEVLVREHRSFSERLDTLKEQLGHYRERERALNEALLAAQELREEARSQAERDAAVRLREAETHAEAILLEADQSIRRSQQRLREIHAQRERFLRSLRGLLQRFADNLEVEETRLEEEPAELGDLLHRLERESPTLRRDRIPVHTGGEEDGSSPSAGEHGPGEHGPGGEHGTEVPAPGHGTEDRASGGEGEGDQAAAAPHEETAGEEERG